LPVTSALQPATAAPLNTLLRITVGCALLTLILHLPWLGTPPLAGTEAHRALTAHQMVERGDWSVPMLYGRVYLRKPPLHYWLLATAETLTGQANTWVWRIPSALCAALTTAAVAFFAGRWWGVTAGWAGGLLQAGMVALWTQSRSCDIDALNTLLATAATLAWAHLLTATLTPPSRAAWISFTGLTLAGVIAAKGPAGLPPLAGLLIATAILQQRSLLQPSVWLPWLIAAALTAVWVTLLYQALLARNLPLDFSGVDEAVGNLYDTRLSRFLQAVTLPLLLLAYSLPTTALILLALRHRRQLNPQLQLLTLSLACSWLVCTLSGMVNPRYAYPTFPLVAVTAAGAIAHFIAAGHWPSQPVTRLLKVWAVTLPLLALPMAFFTLQNKQDRSGLAAAQAIHQAVGHLATPDRPVLMGRMLRFQPELLYYANVPGRSLAENLPDPKDLPAGALILAAEDELQKLQAAGTVEELGRFVTNKRQACIVEWLGPNSPPR